MSDLIGRIRQLDQRDGILFFSRIMAYFAKTGWSSRAHHFSFIRGLIPGDVFAQLLRLPSKFVIFSPFSILLIVKLLCIHGRSNPSAVIAKTVPTETFRDIILYANDNVDATYDPTAPPVEPDVERGAGSLLQLWTFRLEPPTLLQWHIARNHHIYVTLAERIGPRHGVDLSRYVHEAIGLTPFEFFSLGFGAYTHIFNKVATDVQKGFAPTINPRTYFGTSAIDAAKVASFFDQVSIEPRALAAALDELEPGLPLQSQTLALARRPFLRIGPEELCLVAPPYLEGLISTGLIHLVIRNRDREIRERILNFNGALVEAYAGEVLNSIWPDIHGLARRLYPSRLVDSLVDSTPSVLLFETKASLIRRGVLTSGRLGDYLEEFKKKFISKRDRETTVPKGIGQLAHACALVNRDGVPEISLAPVSARNLFPILVTAHPVPQFPYFWKRYNELIDAEYPDFRKQARQVQILDLAELEMLEILAEHGLSVADSLRERDEDVTLQYMEFGEYALGRMDRLRVSSSRRLKNLLTKAMEDTARSHFPRMELEDRR